MNKPSVQLSITAAGIDAGLLRAILDLKQLLICVALLVAALPAYAQSQPPALAAADSGKAGPLMANLRLGGGLAFAAVASGGSGTAKGPGQFHLGVELGVALNAARSVYLILPFTFAHIRESSYGFAMIPLGIQGDIAISAIPGLFLYPRLSIGYAAGFIIGDRSAGTANLGVITPEFGVKYVVMRRVNLAVEPFSMPILFDKSVALVNYRFNFGAGVNF